MVARRWLEHVWPALLVVLVAARPVGTVGTLALLIAVTWVLVCAVNSLARRVPAKPRAPRRRVAPMPRLRPEPRRTVPVLAHSCVICGRPLTNRQSMLARVGSTCIKTYGPRPAWRPNPDHAAWAHELARARGDQAVEQVRLDTEHERALAEHLALVDAWEQERASPEGQARRRRRDQALGLVGSSLVWVLAVATSAA